MSGWWAGGGGFCLVQRHLCGGRLARVLHPSPPPPPAAGEALLRAQLASQATDAPQLYHLPYMRMWTKLRPGVREFLEAARQRWVRRRWVRGPAWRCL